MDYRVKVKAGTKQEGVTILRDGRLEIRVNAPRKEGLANERACELLALHLGIPVSKLTIVKGHNQPTKLIRALY